VVLAPLAAVPELKEPQLPEGVQVQVTPALAESLLTRAAMVVTAVTPMVPGGAGCNATEMDCEGVVLSCVLPLPPPQAEVNNRRQTKDRAVQKEEDFRMKITSNP
jgi:hypothetical protein